MDRIPPSMTWSEALPVPAFLADAGGADPKDVLWGHCRNILGIARLLVHERRSTRLVSTACYMAVDTARRVADISEPEVAAVPGWSAAEHLAWAERQVAGIASRLRTDAPGRSWNV